MGRRGGDDRRRAHAPASPSLLNRPPLRRRTTIRRERAVTDALRAQPPGGEQSSIRADGPRRRPVVGLRRAASAVSVRRVDGSTGTVCIAEGSRTAPHRADATARPAAFARGAALRMLRARRSRGDRVRD